MGRGFLGKSEKNGRVLKSLLDTHSALVETENYGEEILKPKRNRRASWDVREGTSYAYLQRTPASLQVRWEDLPQAGRDRKSP